ncbi:MAG: DNA repair protein RecN [Clostridia bacterium]|nr:DNA repair protein RecN [Clostridia bacterium]
MLNRLFIKNIAVIESAEIEFRNGFNILTGETGAGKSIIIDSVNILKGERASKDLIRSGEQKARVDGVFTIDVDTQRFLSDEYGIEAEDGQILISREITADGKNNIRINGMPTIGSVLKEVGANLVTIHGQHDNTSLLAKKTHLALLDGAAGDDVANTLLEYKTVYDEIKKKETELDSIETDEQEKTRRLDMLSFQIDEIEGAMLEVGEDDELFERKAFLENAGKIAENTQEAYAFLYDGDQSGKSANDMLWDGINALGQVAEYDAELKKIYDELSDLGYEISDKFRNLRKYIDGLTYEPHELEEVEDRLDLIYNLKRKYGSTIELILKYLADAKVESENIIRSDERVHELKEEIEKLCKKRDDIADKLTSLRKSAGEKLSFDIETQLADLNMAKVKFTVKIEEGEYTAKGKDDVEFMICTNVGEDFKPLTKIASGGELSRIMLAIKSVLTAGENASTLVFDEIDAGVSGSAAQKIGEKLRAISLENQVICITHLPQIAALADIHFLIEKNVVNDRTLTTVKSLEGEDRVRELARTLGGATVTEVTMANARELLNQAKQGDKRNEQNR